MDDKERVELRRQARARLRAEPTEFFRFEDKIDAKYSIFVQQPIQHRRQHPDFAGVRGYALAKPPEPERQARQKLWDDVEALRKRAAERGAVAGMFPFR